MLIYQPNERELTMIQIEDWVAIAVILAFFILSLSYLIYFIITRKLFPKVVEFQKEIDPHKSIDVITIEGQGILKKVEMQISENNNSSIMMIVDRRGYATFGIGESVKPENFIEPKGSQLKFEVNLEVKFYKDFSLFIDNRNESKLNSSGRIFYEIKKPLKYTLFKPKAKTASK